MLFCGINPGLWSAAVGAHFARPGNRFWKVLYAAGFTDRLLAPSEQAELVRAGIGITNLVDRATASAGELTPDELHRGAVVLEKKAAALRPGFVAFCGMLAYRSAFGRPRAGVGRQAERLATSGVWVLPNPSGLQARYQMPELVVLFGDLRRAAEKV